MPPVPGPKRCFEQLLRINPLDATVHARYGWTQFTKFRRLSAGIRAMEKSIELDSTNSWAYSVLGDAYLQKGEPSKALEMIEKYIALNPTDVHPLNSKAEIQLYIGQYDQAITNCERILATEPEFLSARIILARAFIAQGKYSHALETLSQYMELAKNLYFMSIGHTVKVNIHFLRGELKQALDTVEQAIAMDSTNVEAHWMHGRILLQAEDKNALDDAVAALDRALLAQGGLDGRWFLYHLQSEMALSEGAFDRAIERFDKALDLGNQDRSFYLAALANAYERSGQMQKAAEQYNLALAFNPNNALASFAIARTFEELGKLAEAREAYEKVAEIWSQADDGIRELNIARQKISKFKLIPKN